MTASECAHWIGLVGEALNLLGAGVLAADIFLRRKERVRAERLMKVRDFAARSNLKSATYEGFRASNPDLPFLVLERHATRLASWGLTCMILGFIALVLYHGLEIREARSQNRPENIILDRNIGKSDNQ